VNRLRLAQAAWVLCLAWVLWGDRLWTPRGFARTVYSELGERGAATTSHVLDATLAFMAAPHGPRRLFSVRWRGVWFVDEPGAYTIYLGADDWARASVDGQPVGERSRERGYGTIGFTRTLSAGPHTIDLQYEQQGGGAFLNAGWSRDGGGFRPFSSAEIFPSPAARSWRWLERVLWWLAAAGALLGTPLVWREMRRAWHWTRAPERRNAAWWKAAAVQSSAALARRPRLLEGMALAVILTLGLLLRLDAILVRYGPFDHPVWLAETDAHATDRIERWLRPQSFSWAKIPVPYVGGDPINYLRFGRDMRSFYAAHVREPMFPAAVHVWLWLTGDVDVGLSFASATFSFLAIVATWWLGRVAYGVWVGLLAAFGMAMDHDLITWSADGWRDDTLMFFAVWVAIGLLLVAWRPRWGWAAFLGVAAAGAVLTRVTALSFVVPGFAAVALFGRGPWRPRLQATGVAAVLAAALAAPYFYNCWRAFGDPLYAINVHTSFYRARAGEAYQEPMSVGTYLKQRAAADPVGLAKTAAIGLFWFPFENKWIGFDFWWLGLRRFLMGMGAVGLLLLPLTRRGRFLWLVILGVLLPYAFTWSIPGGGEWRFTMPAYPFYLVAAALAIVTTAARLPAFADRVRAMIGHGRQRG
jgi:hypothetical protein